MNAADTAALVSLSSDPGRLTIADVIAAGGAQALLEQRHGLFAAEALADAYLRIDRWRSAGVEPLGFADHPECLADMATPPPLLWLRGALQDRDVIGVSLIGSRHPSPEGLADAARAAAELSAQAVTVVSGLAAGIDTAAHQSALRGGGRTLAVLGNGHGHVYPPANAELQLRVQVAVSQFPPETPPSRESFPERNAVMAAISRATVIVEAGDRSGARIQARHALAQGRQLILFARVLRNPWAEALAAEAGVAVISSADGLLDVL